MFMMEIIMHSIHEQANVTFDEPTQTCKNILCEKWKQQKGGCTNVLLTVI